jgi:hypothetical protein
MLNADIITYLSFDGDAGETETYLSREAVVSETYNGEIKRCNSYKWSESLSPSITIIKEDFSDFTRDDNREILSWLTGRKSAGFLDIYSDDSGEITYSILGNFVKVSQYKNGNSSVIGYIAQFESLMPWALSDLEEREEDVSDHADNTFTITINTDEPESAVYPKITIINKGENYVRIADGVELTESSPMIVNTAYWNGETFYWRTLNPTKKYDTTKPSAYSTWIEKVVDHEYGDNDTWETGYIYKYNNTYYWLEPANTLNSSLTNPELSAIGVKITNTYTANGKTEVTTCSIANNALSEIIVLDGANKVISSSSVSRVFGDNFSWDWIPLYDGVNTITVEGNCTAKFEYRTVIKCGDL